MLSRLYIENIAVIERVECELSKGFNVLTGETGAGKSIIIDSINAVLGGRTSRDLIRTGAVKAFVSAQFENAGALALKAAQEQGIEVEDGALIVSREIREDGKNNCRINGRPVTVAALKEVGRYLINIHGQHETTALLNPDTHIHYVDALAENSDLLRKYKEIYNEYKQIRIAIVKLDSAEKDKQNRADMLRYRVEELSSAALRDGEAAELTEKRSIIRNFENINRALSAAVAALYGDEDSSGACEAVSSAYESTSAVSAVFPQVKELSSRLKEAGYELGDIADTLRAELSAMEFDPDELDAIETRLSVLENIIKRYGSEKEAIAYLDEASKELEMIDNSEFIRQELEEKRLNTLKRLEQAANKITDSRLSAAKSFTEKVEEELSYLDMPSVRLSVSVQRTNLTENGCDSIEFLICTNAGEEPKSLSRIASGGELSRIMLAFKNVLAGKDNVDTLIFDEIDTGISGKAAQKVALKLKEVSAARQIICVTHLAQIAARADTHLFISKNTENGRTSTSVSLLDYNEREHEIARIISGDSITEAVLETAAQMLSDK